MDPYRRLRTWRWTAAKREEQEHSLHAVGSITEPLNEYFGLSTSLHLPLQSNRSKLLLSESGPFMLGPRRRFPAR